MEPHIWKLLEEIRPKAKFSANTIIQAEDWISWKKKRIAKVRAWMKKRGRK